MSDPMDHPPLDHGSDRHGYVEISYGKAVIIDPDPPPEMLEGACLDCLPNLFLRWDGMLWTRTVAHDPGCPSFEALRASDG